MKTATPPQTDEDRTVGDQAIREAQITLAIVRVLAPLSHVQRMAVLGAVRALLPTLPGEAA